MELFALQAIWAVLAIILIDIVLAGDNALVIGMAANKLPPAMRKKAIFRLSWFNTCYYKWL